MALLGVLPPRNPLTDLHKIWRPRVIASGMPLNTPNGMSVSSGGDSHEVVKC